MPFKRVFDEDKKEICPICNVVHRRLVHRFHETLEADVIFHIQTDFPTWKTADGICSRCYDEFEALTYHEYRASDESSENFKLKFLDFYIFPTAQRLNADAAYSGKGVTICFIDSGFYKHPDIAERILHIEDITNPSHDETYFETVHDNAWHGTMTSTVCSGNGTESKGVYKGLANNANLVLLKVQNDEGKITDDNIAKALQWVLKNKDAYNIRIVNLSLGGDLALPNDLSEINRLAELLFQNNVLVVSAVGNTADGKVLPPASSPHVIAVGGLDDQNKLEGEILLYHSTYGVTVDGYSKPEMVTNSIWVPAPILPNTPQAEKAKVLFHSLENEDYLHGIIENNKAILKEEHFNLFEGKEKLWKEVKQVIWREKFITPHYMHVDGTSFAAPLVTSVAAQMLEANPALTSQELRQILLQTSAPVPTFDISRQGFGRMQPKMAVYAVLNRDEFVITGENPIVDDTNGNLTFYVHQPKAKLSVSLVGSFNHWKKNEIILKPAKNDIWYVTLPKMKPGRHEYKFYVDGWYWVEDISNPWRVVDEYGGWNSVFEIKN